MLGKKYPLSKYYIATVTYGSAGCIRLLLVKDNGTYYNISEHETLDTSINGIRYKQPLSKYVNEDYEPIKMLTKGEAKRLAKHFYEDFHADLIAYISSDEYQKSLKETLPVLPISIT